MSSYGDGKQGLLAWEYDREEGPRGVGSVAHRTCPPVLRALNCRDVLLTFVSRRQRSGITSSFHQAPNHANSSRLEHHLLQTFEPRCLQQTATTSFTSLRGDSAPLCSRASTAVTTRPVSTSLFALRARVCQQINPTQSTRLRDELTVAYTGWLNDWVLARRWCCGKAKTCRRKDDVRTCAQA